MHMLDCKMRAGRDRFAFAVKCSHIFTLLVFSLCVAPPATHSDLSVFIFFVLYSLPQWLHLNTVLACLSFFSARFNASCSVCPARVQAHERRDWRKRAEIEHGSAILERACQAVVLAMESRDVVLLLIFFGGLAADIISDW